MSDFTFNLLDSATTTYDLIVIDRSLKKLVDHSGSDLLVHFMSYLADNGVLIVLENNRYYYKGFLTRKNDHALSVSYMRNMMRDVTPEVATMFLSRFLFNDDLKPLPEIYNVKSVNRDQKVVGDFLRGIREKLLYTTVGGYFWAGALLCVQKKDDSLFKDLIRCDPFFSSKPKVSVTVQRIVAGNFGVQVVIFSDQNDNQYVLRLFLSQLSVKYAKINSSALKRYNRMVPGLDLPEIISEYSYNGFEYTIETKVKGKEVIYIGRSKGRVFRRANEKWFRYQLSQSKECNAEYIETSLLEPLRSCLLEVYPGKKQLISTLYQALITVLDKSDNYRVMPAHGDYKLGNILFEGDEVVSLIDWDHCFDNCLPLYDQLTFILYYLSKTKQMDISEVYKSYILPWHVDGYISRYFTLLMNKMNISHQQFEFLRVIFWVMLLVHRFGDKNVDNILWVNSMVDDVLSAIISHLKYESA
ncbi:MAG: aminoglycoside phosphotransferase family protein [Gammaproteobacteria bacterium]|nr:aminoglycoside phosphotransferase family protein [Gammaproteobacteria bacterium]